VHEIYESLMGVHTNMSSHVIDLGNNDNNVSSSRNFSIIAQNPRNGNYLLSKDHENLGVSSNTI
jgi:hypothetical protein